MEHLIKTLAQHWDLSPAGYWHLRLLSSIAFGPLLGILCLGIFSRRSRSQSKIVFGR